MVKKREFFRQKYMPEKKRQQQAHAAQLRRELERERCTATAPRRDGRQHGDEAERRRRREEKEARARQRADAVLAAQRQKADNERRQRERAQEARRVRRRTARGQPVMKHAIAGLLAKIERMKRES